MKIRSSKAIRLLKSSLKIQIAFIFYYIGFFRLVIFYKGHKPLTYHNIIPDCYFDNALHLGVSHSEGIFRKQMEVLSTFFCKEELTITFDDGYLNNLLVAIPILNEYRICGKFFIPLIKDEKSKPFWVDRIMYLFSYSTPKSYSFGDIIINLEESKRLAAFVELFAFISKNYAKKIEVMINVDRYIDDMKYTITNEYYNLRFTFINESELTKMFEDGHTLGFHSLHHDIYRRLTVHEIEHELKLAKNKLLKYQIDSFSFPFGGQEEINIDSIPMLESFGLSKIYSNVGKELNINILQRRSLPNTSNKYLILAYYCNLF